MDCHQQIGLHVMVAEAETHMHEDCCFHIKLQPPCHNLEKDYVVFGVNAEQFQRRHFLGNVCVEGLKIRVCPDTQLMSRFAVPFYHG